MIGFYPSRNLFPRNMSQVTTEKKRSFVLKTLINFINFIPQRVTTRGNEPCIRRNHNFKFLVFSPSFFSKESFAGFGKSKFAIIGKLIRRTLSSLLRVVLFFRVFCFSKKIEEFSKSQNATLLIHFRTQPEQSKMQGLIRVDLKPVTTWLKVVLRKFMTSNPTKVRFFSNQGKYSL